MDDEEVYASYSTFYREPYLLPEEKKSKEKDAEWTRLVIKKRKKIDIFWKIFLSLLFVSLNILILYLILGRPCLLLIIEIITAILTVASFVVIGENFENSDEVKRRPPQDARIEKIKQIMKIEAAEVEEQLPAVRYVLRSFNTDIQIPEEGITKKEQLDAISIFSIIPLFSTTLALAMTSPSGSGENEAAELLLFGIIVLMEIVILKRYLPSKSFTDASESEVKKAFIKDLLKMEYDLSVEVEKRRNQKF